MFVQILNQVTNLTRKECHGCQYVDDYLIHAISIWCAQLGLNKENPGINDYILQGYQSYKISELTNYLYKEWNPKEEEQRNWLGQIQINIARSKLHDLITRVFNQISVKSEAMVIITFFAFFVTVVGYFIYKLNQQQRQRSTLVEDHKQYPFNPPPPTTQIITKYFLILVASASQADFLESLKAKRAINTEDAERLYKITKYLWLGSENLMNQKKNKINNYSVTIESEYDINLVYIELKQIEEAFKPNINQVDRYDAFRKLPGLVVNFDISPRLRMEAYENFEIYNC